MEVFESLEAYAIRQDEYRQFISHMTAQIVNTQSKKRVKPSDLYKPLEQRRKQAKLRISHEETMKRFAEVAKRAAENQKRREMNGAKTG